MIKTFFWSKKWGQWAYLGGLFLLVSIYAQVHMTVLLNQWYKEFYDILQNAINHTFQDFLKQIIDFCNIAFPYILLATVTAWFTRLYSLRWREAITFDYIPRWRNVEEEIEGASQRIQEDCYRFARIVESLGLQVVRAVMTLIAFLPILWSLSSKVDIDVLKDIPGSLVWVALVVSLGGLTISWFVGWFLPGLEYNNQKVEAAFRKELVYGEDDKENFSSIPTLTSLFMDVRKNYQRLFLHYGYFDLWIYFYDQAMTIMPYLVMAPGLFTGVITLGIMVQVSNAFAKVHGSFSLFIHNWTTITELRSIWKRLHEFEKNLDKYNESNLVGESISWPRR